MTTSTRSCVVPSCTAKARELVELLSFHGFPSATSKHRSIDPMIIRQHWVKKIREARQDLKWEPGNRSLICSFHFSDSSFESYGKCKRLVADAVPTLNLSPVSIGSSSTQIKGNLVDKATQYEAEVVDSESTKQPKQLGSKSKKRLFEDAFQETEQPTVESSFNSSFSSSADLESSLASSFSSIEVTPTSRKRVRDEHSYNTSPGQAADELKGTKQELAALKLKYFNLKRKLDRSENTRMTIKDKLIQQNSLNSSQVDRLNEDFPKLLQSLVGNEKKALKVRATTGMKYDEEIKKFAATLHFYSPKAYTFVREFLTLPHPHTISSWMKSSDCGPGYNTDVINRLSEVRQNDAKNVMTDVVMMIDEMAIRKELVWNPSSHTYEGHIDYGTSDIETEADAPLASNALVCMIAGFSGGWKVPIGYIYTDKIDSEVQKAFVDKAFFLLEEAGFNVHALISDGNTANVSLFEKYGVVENPTPKENCSLFSQIVSSFPNPANTQKTVHAVYDVCHMLKLWRNLLAQCGEIKMRDGRSINWKFIERLFRLQESEKIRAANKLGRNHIEFGNHKMNVKLAAQSLSKSNADAIVFCREKMKMKEFEGSEGTTYFMYLLDKVFDILNSRNPSQKSHKAPLTRRNLNYQTKILDEFCSVVSEMTYSEVRHYKATKTRPAKTTETVKVLVQSARKRAALGMIVSIKSILAVSHNLLYRSINPMRYVMTYRFSQDLLELFFNKVRGRLGRNNNPNTIEFKHTMKAIWHQNLLKSANTGNCIEQMEEGIIPAGLLPLKRVKACKVKPLELEDIGSFESMDLSSFPDPQYSTFYKNCLGYIAGNVVRVVGSKITCETCAEGMLDREEDPLDNKYRQLIIAKDRGGLFMPSKSVYSIVEMADKVFRQLVKESAGSLKLVDLDRKIYKMVMLKCLEIPIFPHINDHFIDYDPSMSSSHMHILIKEIVLHFLKIRLFDYGKRFQKEISTRHTLNKVTLFKGQ